ncbi:hypothetical protein [Acrocarpospora sp. B8E8]|uniref:hypothetical protein n=1 Tax=Acrocarpospora sp. B8E8 TaxID=3153572 RepID=UPI00325DEA0F
MTQTNPQQNNQDSTGQTGEAPHDEDLQNDKADKSWKRWDRITIAAAAAAIVTQIVGFWQPKLPASALSGLMMTVAAAVWLHGHRHMKLRNKKAILCIAFLSAGWVFLGFAVQEVLSNRPNPASTFQDNPHPSESPSKSIPIDNGNQNLIDQKHLAKWETSLGERIGLQSRPRSEERKGYAKTTYADLEDGSSGEGAVIVAAPWKEGSWTAGEFPLARPIKATDRFLAAVGFDRNSEVKEAKFRVECLGGSLSKPARIGEVVNKLDNKLAILDQPLRNCIGATALRLYTVGDKVAGAHLIWVRAQIESDSATTED